RIVGDNAPDVSKQVTMTPGENQLPQAPGTNSYNRTLVNEGLSIDAQNAYEQYKLENEVEQQGLQGNGRVINMLRIAGVHQVMLKVSVAEVDRSATRALGVNLSAGGARNLFGAALSGTPPLPTSLLSAAGATANGLFTTPPLAFNST